VSFGKHDFFLLRTACLVFQEQVSKSLGHDVKHWDSLSHANAYYPTLLQEPAIAMLY